MRIATWNVNSLKARLPRVEEFLGYADVDVLCLQETKLADKAFPALTFRELGYDTVHHGQGQWNGVAILSRVGLDDATAGFGDDLVDPYAGDARLVAATCGGVRVVSVYVPNGRAVDTDHYERKLEWFAVLREWLDRHHSPGDALAILGDYNVAPADRDVWKIEAFAGSTHVTPAERAAIDALCDWGLTDAFRVVYPDVDGLYSYWDYRAGDFHQHRGMRIDLALTSAPVTERVRWAVVDRNARKGTQPSDHAPVIVDLA
jgi:exodeoxyribonuclease-3